MRSRCNVFEGDCVFVVGRLGAVGHSFHGAKNTAQRLLSEPGFPPLDAV